MCNGNCKQGRECDCDEDEVVKAVETLRKERDEARAEVERLRSLPAVPERTWRINEENAAFLRDFIGGDDTDSDGGEACPITLDVGEVQDEDTKEVKYGLRVSLTEYPEDGAEIICECELTAAVRERDEAQAECERVREDAERYRWLRRVHEHWDVLMRESDDDCWQDVWGDRLDAEIDKARGKT